jgi:hypothetical protein
MIALALAAAIMADQAYHAPILNGTSTETWPLPVYCVSGCDTGGGMTIDLPPCAQAGLPSGTPAQRNCTIWHLRQHYHLHHIAPWPHEGEACDPRELQAPDYECRDDDADKPPSGVLW